MQRAALLSGLFLLLFWGLNGPFSVPPRLEVLLCYPFKDQKVFSCHVPSQSGGCTQAVLNAALVPCSLPARSAALEASFLPSFSALASHCSSSSLRNNGLVWSIHCTFLMSQMQRAHDFFFFFAVFILRCGRFWIRN